MTPAARDPPPRLASPHRAARIASRRRDAAPTVDPSRRRGTAGRGRRFGAIDVRSVEGSAVPTIHLGAMSTVRAKRKHVLDSDSDDDDDDSDAPVVVAATAPPAVAVAVAVADDGDDGDDVDDVDDDDDARAATVRSAAAASAADASGRPRNRLKSRAASEQEIIALDVDGESGGGGGGGGGGIDDRGVVVIDDDGNDDDDDVVELLEEEDHALVQCAKISRRLRRALGQDVGDEYAPGASDGPLSPLAKANANASNGVANGKKRRALVAVDDVVAVAGDGSFSANLKPYQMVGVNFLLLLDEEDVPGAILADEMGLGKTAQARSIHWSPYDRVGVVNADP